MYHAKQYGRAVAIILNSAWMPEIDLPDEKKNANAFLTVFERHIFIQISE